MTTTPLKLPDVASVINRHSYEKIVQTVNVLILETTNYERHFKSENENRVDSCDYSVVYNNKIS